MVELKCGGHVIFLCSANRTRSPIAALLFKARMESRGFQCKVESAGVLLEVGFGHPASRGWRDAPLAGQFFDGLTEHVSRHISDVQYTEETIFIGVEPMVVSEIRRLPRTRSENIFLLNPPSGIPDPTFGECSFTDCFTYIHTGISKLEEKLGLNR